eukprot:c4299_g1_i1.p1 GENE.c4299_g1_i1~~c4299_g1_i1.p1  ORF type:complete len:316 (+),score=112.31 c4299_g1_i1:24-950(+)
MGNCLPNCITSTILSILLCGSKCHIDKVAQKLVYFPPKPPTYIVQLKTGSAVLELIDPAIKDSPDAFYAAKSATPFILETTTGSKIPALFFRSYDAKFTIIFSHGNAVDLGVMIDFFFKLSSILKVNMFCYDYTGYGSSVGGVPSENNTYADIESAYDKICSLGIDPSTIILYGQSVGSGPSCYLASKKKVRGLILHGPFMSALDVVSRPGCCSPSQLFCCCNIYRNIDRIPKIHCPVLVIHGKRDEVIPFRNGETIHKKCSVDSKYPPFWVDDGGHNNILEIDPQGYLQSLQDYLKFLETQKFDDYE